MANEKLQYEVTFKTRAEGDGAQKTAAAVRDLTDATNRFNQLSTPEKVGITSTAFYDLDAAATRTKNTIEDVPGAMNKMAAPTRNSAAALLSFSQAAEDSQYGIRGVLNNIPGLVMSLGGGMGLAGAVSLAAVGLNLLFEKLGKTKTLTEQSSLDFQAMADAYVEGVNNALTKLETARELRMDTEAIGDGPDTAGAEAETAAATARNESIAALLAATNTLNELMGRQVAVQEQLAAAEARREESRQQDAAAAIAAEQAKEQVAKQALATADGELSKRMLSRAEVDRALESERERVEILRQQRDEIDAILKLQQPAGGLSGNVQERAQQQIAFLQEQESARANQAGVEASLKQAEEAWASLTERAKGTETAVTRAANAATAAGEELERISAATQVKIAAILEQSEAKLVANTATTVSEKNAALVTQMQAVVTEVEGSGTALTQIQQGGLATLKTVLADGKVTADELDRGVQAVQQVQIGFKGDVAKLIGLNTSVLEVLALYREDLRTLTNRVADLKNGRK